MKTIDDALAFADTFDKPANKYMSIVMLAAEVRRLRDENELLKVDAERYRWLRKQKWDTKGAVCWADGPEQTDAAIDAALAGKDAT